MPYRVTITKIDKDVPFKDKDYQDTGKKDKDGDTIYEYVYFDSTHDVWSEIFDQTVDGLDVSDVVSVVNGLNI